MSALVMTQAAVEVASTAAVDPPHRFDLWEDQVRQTCGTLQVLGDRKGFNRGCIVTGTLGDLRVSLISADPHTVVRQGRAASGEAGHVYVTTPLRGSARVSQDDGQVSVGAGDIVTFDSSRPYTLTMPEPFEMVAVRATHRSLGLTPDNTRHLSANSWSGTTGIGALASRTLAALGQHLTELDEASLAPLGSTVVGLVSTLFAQRLQSATAPHLARQSLMVRICRFIQGCLGDTALDPAMIARRHNVSLRSLQMLFAEHGTSPAKWIREERLRRVHADLIDPRCAHLTVAEIGERWGLVGASQVSRLFKVKYGMTPSEFRRMNRPTPGTG